MKITFTDEALLAEENIPLLPGPKRRDYLDKVCFVGQEATRIPTRPRVDRPSVILPGLESGTDAERDLKLELYDRLSEHVPQSEVHKDGVCDHRAVPDDWSKLRTSMPGFGMNPATIPPVTTIPLRQSLHLSDHITPRDAAIAKRLAVLMTLDRESEGLTLARDSSSSGLLYTKDPKLKRREAMYALINAQSIARLVVAGEWERLRQDYWTVLYHHIVYREQPDAWADGKPKPRMVNHLAYALDPAAHPEARVSATKLLPNGLSRSRTRTAYASSGIPNRILSAVFQPFATSAYRRYSFTWKLKSQSDLEEKTRPYRYVIATDTTQHDQLYTTWIIDLLVEGLARVLRADLLELLKRVFTAPVHLASPWTGKRQSIWLGDPLTGESLDMGLPSGLGPNSFIGRWWMTSNALMWIDRLRSDVLERMESYLQGRESIGLLNSADDMLLLFENQAEYDRIHSILSKPLDDVSRRGFPSYMPLEVQSPASFLGFIPFHDKGGKLKVTRNICSFVVNRLCPEWPITSRKRAQFWAVGLEEVRRLFNETPMFHEVYSLMDRVFLETTGQSFRTFESEYAPAQRARLNRIDLTQADIEVLHNPDKLFYKFDKNDVHPDIWKEHMLGLSGEVTYPLIKPFLL